MLPSAFLNSCQEAPSAPVMEADQPVAFAITDNVVARIQVIPDSQMVFAGDQFTVTAKPKNAAGQVLTRNITWTSNNTNIVKVLGTLTPTMTFQALKVGSTAVKAATDGISRNSKVVVRSTTGAKVVLTPATATVATGANVQFTATGLTTTGDKPSVNVTWSATGGTISTAGLFKAGTTAGAYRVIAISKFGAADTSAVTVTSSTPPPPVDRVVLQPDIAASRPGAVTKFAASLYSSTGTVVAQALDYRATCGSITADGVFTAPTSSSTCSVIASANGKADTTDVVGLQNQGTPFGIFGLWQDTPPDQTQTSGIAPFTASHDNIDASGIIQQISGARAQGIHLIFAMTGGSHENYKTNGVFDLSKWQAKIQTFNTPAIRAAIAQGVADGTIIGNSVLDEPQQSDADAGYRTKSWGPTGTLTRERIDGLCGYVKSIFPTLPVGVFHDPAMFEPTKPYRVCEFIMAQYSYRKFNGNVARWRDSTLTLARRDGLSVVFSFNILNGGAQDKDAVYDCVGPQMGGLGQYSPNCNMTAQQIRDWGKALAPSSCALMTWTFDAAYLTKPGNQAAMSDVALYASGLSRRPCTTSRAPNTPPVAAFSSTCINLSCGFTDASTDDGTIVSWSWDFGDQQTSTAQSPTHTYAAGGPYDVKLTVTDDKGSSNSVTHTVTVSPANSPPVAAFSSTCPDLSCGFTDASTDDGSIASWSWDFGDQQTSTAQSPNHTYGAGGSYDVKLTVTDDKGSSNSVTHTVTVAPNAAPNVEFSATCTDLDCSFTDQSTDDGSVLSWSWDFGDGSSSTDANPIHPYASANDYQVKLTVTDDKGKQASVTHTVTPTAPATTGAAP